MALYRRLFTLSLLILLLTACADPETAPAEAEVAQVTAALATATQPRVDTDAAVAESEPAGAELSQTTAPSATAPAVEESKSAGAEASQATTPAPTLTPPAPTPLASDFQCPLTMATAAYPTDTDVFGASAGAEWFCSADNELCAVKGGTWPAGGVKVGWRKPMGSKLAVSGQRLDAAGPPVGASVPDGYGGTFQASGLIFASAGCWEVEAQAGASSVRFVVEVGEPQRRPRGGACDTLAAAVDSSDGIIFGSITSSKPGPDGRYVWHSVAVRGVAKNPYGSGAFTGIALLQDTDLVPALRPGGPYLFFVQGDPFQLFCPERTLAVVVDGQVIPLNETTKASPLWSEDTLTAIREEIQAIRLGRD